MPGKYTWHIFNFYSLTLHEGQNKIRTQNWKCNCLDRRKLILNHLGKAEKEVSSFFPNLSIKQEIYLWKG